MAQGTWCHSGTQTQLWVQLGENCTHRAQSLAPAGFSGIYMTWNSIKLKLNYFCSRGTKPKLPAHSPTQGFWIFCISTFSLQTKRPQESSFYSFISWPHSITPFYFLLIPWKLFHNHNISTLHCPLTTSYIWQIFFFIFSRFIFYFKWNFTLPLLGFKLKIKNESNALKHWDKFLTGFKLKMNDQKKKSPGISTTSQFSKPAGEE